MPAASGDLEVLFAKTGPEPEDCRAQGEEVRQEVQSHRFALASQTT